MTRDDFLKFVEKTLEEVIQVAENETGKSLPRKIAFRWFSQTAEPFTENIAEQIAERVFIDENNIYPEVDIGVGDLADDGTVLIFANIAGREPEPWGKNPNGYEGPFNYIVGRDFLDKSRKKSEKNK